MVLVMVTETIVSLRIVRSWREGRGYRAEGKRQKVKDRGQRGDKLETDGCYGAAKTLLRLDDRRSGQLLRKIVYKCWVPVVQGRSLSYS